MIELLGKTISQYQIIEKIGEGGMGMVYLARDTKLHRKVALKFLSPHLHQKDDALGRFRREARAAATLNHPNIITIHDINEFEDPASGKKQTYIVMEYLNGMELRDLMQPAENGSQMENAAAPPENRELLRNLSPIHQQNLVTILQIAIQLCRGLEEAHGAGVIHRDLKPENILVDKSGHVKILDFGLAKLKDTTQITTDNSTMGTINYMSPEQLQGMTVDHRTDIWSFGVILFELLSGAVPFQADHHIARMYTILNEEPHSLRELRDDVPEQIIGIIDSCLQKEAKNRPEHIAGVRDVLETQLGSKGQVSNEHRIEKHSPERSTVKPLFKIAAAILFLIALFAAFNADVINNWFRGGGIPVEKHILVLPFTNVAGDRANQAFCDGLVEVLTSKLSQLEQFEGALWVVPSAEVRKRGITTASEATEQFGANLVVSGSVQRSADEIRLTMNLEDPQKMRILNSVVLTEKLAGVSDFQDNVMTQLSQLLEVNPAPEGRKILTAGNTSIPKAYEYYLQGRGYLQNYTDAENLENAIQLFQQAVAEDSTYALAYSGLGEAYFRKYLDSQDNNWVPISIENCEHALKLNKYSPEIYVTLGFIYRKTGKYQNAVTALQQALALDPHNSDAYRELAGAYAKLNKSQEVEKTYLKAIKLKPNYWDNYYRLGIFYFRTGQLENAEKRLLQAIAVSPLNYRLYRDLGNVYFLMEQHQKAIENYSKSIAIEPNSASYINLGALHFDRKEYEEALINYQHALTLNDQQYMLWGNLAFCYDKIPSKKTKAVDAYKRAIELAERRLEINPNEAKVMTSLATYCLEIGEIARSKSLISEALRLAPDNIEILFRAAEVYAGMKNNDQAMNLLESAISKGYSTKRIMQSEYFAQLIDSTRFQGLLKSDQTSNSHY